MKVSEAFKIRTASYWNLQNIVSRNCRQIEDAFYRQLDKIKSNQWNFNAWVFPWEFHKIMEN